jgi:uncharacterized protein (DUF2147 family)
MKNQLNKESMMKLMKLFSAALLSLTLTSPVFADAPTAAGQWLTIDDKTHLSKSVVAITADAHGILSGTVQQTITHPNTPPPVKICTLCPGERKNKPVVGMLVMWDLKPIDKNTWGHGEIIDPKTGTTYSCKIKLSDDGKTLTVRGYLGISLLGRSQTWIRQ